VAQTHLPSNFTHRLLWTLGAKDNKENNRFINAQIRCEGGTAKWNPLNSTMRLSGSYSWTEEKNYNTTGVCNYRYGIAGVCATALTFNLRDYQGNLLFPGLLADFKAGTKTAEQIVNDNIAEIKLWGTNPDLMLQVLKSMP